MLRHTFHDYIEEDGRVFHELVHNQEVGIVGMEDGWQVTAQFPVHCVGLVFCGEVWRVKGELHIRQEEIFPIGSFCEEMDDVDEKADDIQADLFTGCVHE